MTDDDKQAIAYDIDDNDDDEIDYGRFYQRNNPVAMISDYDENSENDCQCPLDIWYDWYFVELLIGCGMVIVGQGW